MDSTDSSIEILHKDTICRTCSQSHSDLVSIFDIVHFDNVNKTWEFLLFQCTSLKVSKDDKIPHVICKICSDQLLSSYQFREKCYKSLENFEESVNSSLKQNINEFSYSDDETVSNFSANLDNLVTDAPPIQIKNKKNLNCTLCEKKFTRYASVKRHMTAHTGLKPHSCTFCNRSFTQSGTLSIHLRAHKEYIDLKKVKPKSKHSLHLCSICGKSFKQSSSLTIHLRRHTGDRPYTCKVCQKSFISNSKLSCHNRVHTGERPYECKYCKKKFSQTTILNKHLKTHLNIKPYKCIHCQGVFSSSYYLNIHVRKHTGEKPLNCDICQKSFYDPKNLKQHKLIHNGDKPFLCMTCGKTFKRIHHLRVHMKTHNN